MRKVFNIPKDRAEWRKKRLRKWVMNILSSRSIKKQTKARKKVKDAKRKAKKTPKYIEAKIADMRKEMRKTWTSDPWGSYKFPKGIPTSFTPLKSEQELSGGIKTWAKEHKKFFRDAMIDNDEFIHPLKSDLLMKPKKPTGGGLNWGSYPAPLGVHHVFTISITKFGKTFIGILAQNPRIGTDIIKEISMSLRWVYGEARDFGMKKIDRYAPRDTGELRMSLRKSIDWQNGIAPRTNNIDLSLLEIKMRIFSKLEYSGILTRMDISNVRHHRSQKIKSWKTGKFLHDPHAAPNYFYSIKYAIQRYVRNKLLPKFIEKVRNHFNKVNIKATKQKAYNMFNIRTK